MSAFRQSALNEAASHTAGRHFIESGRVPDYFGSKVFDRSKMEKYLSASALEALRLSVRHGKPIGRAAADEIADAMKNWAVGMGATHYTHLFQPLTGMTAEKHEAFISVTPEGKPFERFSGAALVQQEPDASSFPCGGLRNTFEARGYSAWDPTSPVFVLDETLCIPSVFVSYTGEALDMKIPHLRSMQALDKAASAVARLFDPEVRQVSVNLGLEQEYFLVDEALYNARPDLRLCQRTVIGHTSAKDQQLSDHYFGAIPSRVMAFMQDFETEACKLGIRLETRHNEVAPNQFETVSAYTEATTAIDQNMLLMIIMQKVAEKHHLKVLFHEKPFDGINGSGKHCNWSLRTDNGTDLLSPGGTPEGNLQFLSFYAAVLDGVCRHHFLLMASVSSLGNGSRLGSHEAPPAVFSVFSGSTLTRIFDELAGESDNADGHDRSAVIRAVQSLPEIFPDNTDRNRTSPFAFTGNRFEFRALGASMNAAATVFILNTVVADSLRRFHAEVTALEAAGRDRPAAVRTAVGHFLKGASKVRFEGNGYSREWAEEAQRRGLEAVTDAPAAYRAYLREETVELFGSLGVLSRSELAARKEVMDETFVKKLQIEARVIGDICLNHVIPAAVAYRNVLIRGIRDCREVYGEACKTICRADMDTYAKISSYVNRLHEDVEELVELRKKANRTEDMAVRAALYSTQVKPQMDKVRNSADHLEMLVDDELWPLPKYRELLFF